MAITPLIQEYIVDFASNNNFFFVNAVQGDGHNVRFVKLALTNNGQPYYIPVDGSAVAIVRGTTSNGSQYLDTETGEIIDSSTIQFELRQSMILYPGKGKFEVCIVNKESNQLLTSFPFYVCVSASGFDTQSITGDESTTFIDLVDALNRVEKSITNANSALDQANNALELAADVDEQGELAEKQGNYAKIQGDHASQKAYEAEVWAKAAEQAVKDIQGGLAINDESTDSHSVGWSAYKLTTEFENINEKLRIYTSFYIDGSVEVNNIDNTLIMNDEGNVYMASPTVDSNNDNGDVSMNSNDLNIEDDGNGNVSITNE